MDDAREDIKEPDLAAMAVGKNQGAISVGELINMCNTRIQTMGNTNPNKWLLYNCAYALKQLVERIVTLEKERNMINTRVQ